MSPRPKVVFLPIHPTQSQFQSVLTQDTGKSAEIRVYYPDSFEGDRHALSQQLQTSSGRVAFFNYFTSRNYWVGAELIDPLSMDEDFHHQPVFVAVSVISKDSEFLVLDSRIPVRVF